MIFGDTPIDAAEGAILAHSLVIDGVRYRKGATLSAQVISALKAARVNSVVAARLEQGDVPENVAALRIAEALAPAPADARLDVSTPTAGRVNLLATATGLFDIGADLVHALNGLDESVTLATLSPNTWTARRSLVATVKIIPYAAPEGAVAAAEALCRDADAARPRLHAAAPLSVRLITTVVPGMTSTLIEKGVDAVRARLDALGLTLVTAVETPHLVGALSGALTAAQEDAVLILAASATSDRRDVAPAAIEAAGGTVERVGMPVDPGNLLVTGRLGRQHVIGLPGCARSPALNGADWVLQRLAAKRWATPKDIALMGPGGLLKEIPARPAPRLGPATGPRGTMAGVLLAAGGSQRMGPGRHKLLEQIDGVPLVRRAAAALTASGLDEVVVVLGARADEMKAALCGLPLRLVENSAWRDGMASSLRVGLLATGPAAEAVLVALADMPDVDAPLIDALLSTFDPDAGREIVRPLGIGGRPGHPVLFGRRFFEPLSGLSGDHGARAIIDAHQGYVADVSVGDARPLRDLDTPEDWAQRGEGLQRGPEGA